MQLVPFELLFADFDKRVQKCRLPLKNYQGHWKCACGKIHYGLDEWDVICQGVLNLIVRCPDDNRYVTALLIKTKFMGVGFKGIETLRGSYLGTESDILLARYIREIVEQKKWGIDVMPFLIWFKKGQF